MMCCTKSVRVACAVEATEHYSCVLSDSLTNSMVELFSVGPRVQRTSSLAGSQHEAVTSACGQAPKRMLRRLRMVEPGLERHGKSTQSVN